MPLVIYQHGSINLYNKIMGDTIPVNSLYVTQI